MEYVELLKRSLQEADKVKKTRSDLIEQKAILSLINNSSYSVIMNKILSGLSNTYIDGNISNNYNTKIYPSTSTILYVNDLVLLGTVSDILKELKENQLFVEGYLDIDECYYAENFFIGYIVFVTDKGKSLLLENESLKK